MTLDELLALARDIAPADIHPQFANEPGVRLARAVVDLLGEVQPCGFEPPCVDAPNQTVAIMGGDGDPLYELSPAEARWFAAELLRGADECDAHRGEAERG